LSRELDEEKTKRRNLESKCLKVEPLLLFVWTWTNFDACRQIENLVKHLTAEDGAKEKKKLLHRTPVAKKPSSARKVPSKKV
jgi:hypothetical protein